MLCADKRPNWNAFTACSLADQPRLGITIKEGFNNGNDNRNTASFDFSRDSDDFFTTSLDNGDHKRGIGLGLAICKAIVEAHKGEIKAFNNDLGGATFELSLPLEEENNE